MPNLSTAEIIGYVSVAILLLSTLGEAIRHARKGAQSGVSPWAFGGGFVAAVGMTVKCVLEHEVLFAALSGALSVYALGVFVLAVANARIVTITSLREMQAEPPPLPVFSVSVRPGETLGTSRDFARAVEMMPRVQR